MRLGSESLGAASIPRGHIVGRGAAPAATSGAITRHAMATGSMATGATAAADVSIRPFAQPVVGRSIGIAWREGGPREDEARMLADVLRTLF